MKQRYEGWFCTNFRKMIFHNTIFINYFDHAVSSRRGKIKHQVGIDDGTPRSEGKWDSRKYKSFGPPGSFNHSDICWAANAAQRTHLIKAVLTYSADSIMVQGSKKTPASELKQLHFTWCYFIKIWFTCWKKSEGDNIIIAKFVFFTRNVTTVYPSEDMCNLFQGGKVKWWCHFVKKEDNSGYEHN